MSIDLQPQELELVKGILALHLPCAIPVLVFGSRGNGQGNAHRASDIDLALITTERLTSSVLTNLREAFTASDLPYTVDLVDWSATDRQFQQKILAGFTVLSPDFFISYTAHDLGWADWLAYQLEDAGYSTVLQAWDFKAGESFVERMHSAARFSRHTLAVLSPDYLVSDWCKAEMLAALGLDPVATQQKFIGVKVAPCTPDGLLAGRIHIDLQGKGEQAARAYVLDEIKKALNTGRNKLEQSPAFPNAHFDEAPLAALLRRATRVGFAAAKFPSKTTPFIHMPSSLDDAAHFVGRHGIYQDVQAALLQSTVSGQTLPQASPVVVCGGAGVGKTMLALRLAQGVAYAFDAVCWVNAETPSSLLNGFASLADADGLALGLPLELKQHERIAVVKAHIEQSARVLLVLDNAETLTDIQSYLPNSAGAGSRALLTSRHTRWDRMRCFDLGVFSKEETAQFWQQHGQSDWQADGKEIAAAQTLSEELGHLPLALRQAAAYMAGVGLTPSAYLMRWQDKSQQLALLQNDGELSDYPKSLASVLALSLEKLETQSPAALELLRLCSLIAPDDVPLDLLHQGLSQLVGTSRAQFESTCPALAELTKPDGSISGWDGVRRALHRTGVAQCKGEILSWHRLSCLYVRLSLLITQQQAALSVMDVFFDCLIPPDINVQTDV